MEIRSHEDFDDDTYDGLLECDELVKLESDWDVVLQMLPTGWQDKARELGAIKRSLRNFSDVESMLRVLMIHLSSGNSLILTAATASIGGIANISSVAVFKRLRECGPWFQWMTEELARRSSISPRGPELLAGRRLRLIDGSTVSEPAATGSTWRLHYSLDLRTLSCDEVLVTDTSKGESLARHSVKPGDVLIADRGYAKSPGLMHVLRSGGDVVLRTGLSQIAFADEEGSPLKLLEKLRRLRVGEASDWAAFLPNADGDPIPVRVCAYRKSNAQTKEAVKAIETEAKKKRRAVKPETLESAGYVIVLTTLEGLSADAVLELYRRRWQIELAFKRLKSLLQLGHLKKIDEQGARAWLQGKVLVACLVEALIRTGELFSPWGYLSTDKVAAPVSMA